MDYYSCNRSQDDIMRMPIDGYAFKDIEDRWPVFKEEPHNMKLSLVADVVNQFGGMRFVYSI